MLADLFRTRPTPAPRLAPPDPVRDAYQEPFDGFPISRFELRPDAVGTLPWQAQHVLVVAYSNWEGLSRAPWLFKAAGWQVDAFTRAHTFLARSSHVQRLETAPDTLPAFVERLRLFLDEHGHRYARVVIGDDPLLWELARRRSDPWARKLLPCDRSDHSIDFLVSKIEFIRRCEQAGLPVPRSRACQDRAAVTAAARMLGFPVVIKQKEGYSGQGVSIVDSEAALERLPLADEVLVQQFVNGPVCSAAALYEHGRLKGFFAYRRERTWGRLGASAAVRLQVFPALREILQGLGRISGFDGLCGIDFIAEEGSGKLLLLEQNFRPTLTMQLGRRVGVDFSRLLRRLADPMPLTPPCLQDPDVTDVVPLFPNDVLRAISDQDVRGLLRWLWHPLWWRELGWHDPQLLVHNLIFVLRFTRDKLLRRLRSHA